MIPLYKWNTMQPMKRIMYIHSTVYNVFLGEFKEIKAQIIHIKRSYWYQIGYL